VSRNHLIYFMAITFSTIWLNGCSATASQSILSSENIAQYNARLVNYKGIDLKINQEHDLLIQAILNENKKNFEASATIYTELYRLTSKEEYALKEIESSLYIGKVSPNLEILERLAQKNPPDLKNLKLLLFVYLTQKEYAKSKEIAQRVMNYSKSPYDYELCANPYIITNDYKMAVSILNKAYEKLPEDIFALKIALILEQYLHDNKGAIRILEKHVKEHGCNEKICTQLYNNYLNEKNIPALIKTYERIYAKTKKEEYLRGILRIYISIRDYKKAEQILQTQLKDNELLLEVYKDQKDYPKILQQLQKMYKETLATKWLSQEAIYIYESSKDKNNSQMLQLVVKKFDEALKKGEVESLHLNYYGYTLIEHNLNVKKGIRLVEEALKSDKNNGFYIDSLAWGYYKLGECKKAYDIIYTIGTQKPWSDEIEVKEHFDAIKKCNNKR